jgi:hypothetical protein
MAWQPYSGDQGSGHQGGASRDAEQERRSRLDQALIDVSRAGSHGLTWREYASKHGLHHGQASSALSNLHRCGLIAKLRDRRFRCGVYVVPNCIEGRETVPFRPNRAWAEVERLRAEVERLQAEIDMLRSA